jgi:hypothetical protein
MEHLEQTIPAARWINEGRFRISVEMTNGRLIVVRFDASSCGNQRFIWNAEKVVEHFWDCILVDLVSAYGEYLNVASYIANLLNERVEQVRFMLHEHVRISYRILDALRATDTVLAYQLLVRLAHDLDGFEPEAEQIWGEWVRSAYDHLGPPGTLGILISGE